MTDDKKRLRPIKRLRRTTSREVQQLVRHFERRAKGSTTAAELVKRRAAVKPDERWTDIPSVQEDLAISHALYDAGRLTWEEYFLHCVFPVERLHDHLSMHGDLRAKLDPIMARLSEIEAQHGLKPGESWRRGEGPDEFKRESARFAKTKDDAFGKLLQDLGLRTHARLWREDQDEFWRQREAGRSAAFEPWDIENALVKLIGLYEGEAKKCANAKAYYAACVMLGSSSEALLLLKCHQEPTELAEARAKLPVSNRFDKRGPQYWNLNQLIEIAKVAGWVSDVATENVVVHIANLMAQLHDTRNLVHPGRHASSRPHITIGKEQYDDAKAAYRTMRLLIEPTIKYDRTKALLKK